MPLRAALAVLGAATMYSFTPLLVHTTARESNPFYFNLVFMIALTILLILFLIVTKKKHLDPVYVNGMITENAPKLTDRDLWLTYFKRTTSDEENQGLKVTLAVTDVSNPAIGLSHHSSGSS